MASRNLRAKPNQFHLTTSGAEAPAVAIARSKRAIGQACPTLLGKPKADIDKNATRDVTAMLAKSGMAMRVDRTKLVSWFGFSSTKFFFPVVVWSKFEDFEPGPNMEKPRFTPRWKVTLLSSPLFCPVLG